MYNFITGCVLSLYYSNVSKREVICILTTRQIEVGRNPVLPLSVEIVLVEIG